MDAAATHGGRWPPLPIRTPPYTPITRAREISRDVWGCGSAFAGGMGLLKTGSGMAGMPEWMPPQHTAVVAAIASRTPPYTPIARAREVGDVWGYGSAFAWVFRRPVPEWPARPDGCRRNTRRSVAAIANPYTPTRGRGTYEDAARHSLASSFWVWPGNGRWRSYKSKPWAIRRWTIAPQRNPALQVSVLGSSAPTTRAAWRKKPDTGPRVEAWAFRFMSGHVSERGGYSGRNMQRAGATFRAPGAGNAQAAGVFCREQRLESLLLHRTEDTS